MGLFGVAELLIMAEASSRGPARSQPRLLDLLPNREDWRASGSVLRGSGIGFFLGLLPGGGAILSSFSSYVLERRSRVAPEFRPRRHRRRGRSELANNAAAQAAFIPLLCLGIPANAVMGVILGALLIKGIAPGPRLIGEPARALLGNDRQHVLGNVMLVVLNVPLVGVFVSFLRIPGTSCRSSSSCSAWSEPTA